jgi:phenylalanyl-tRNA synthetase alpha chain
VAAKTGWLDFFPASLSAGRMSEIEPAAVEADELTKLAALRERALKMLAEAADLPALEACRVELLGKASELARLLKELGGLPAAERPIRAMLRNALKDTINRELDARRTGLEEAALTARLSAERMDISAPVRPEPLGLIHPISRTVEEIAAIFGAMGFAVKEGPDVEDDWFAFGALNIPGHHPARAMMDTFYLNASIHAGTGERRALLRPHTSSVQIRTMLDWARTEGRRGAAAQPIRIIVPGRTFRSDHDATHSPMFHQFEGLVIGRDITLAHLKGCLIDFLRAFFNVPDLPVRFRASYFPFTEPSMEVDIGWNRKSGEIGKGAAAGGSDWLEILGSGMVHANVLANCGIDPREYQGFAFGVGIERITMLKHGIADLRNFYDNDVRWLRHYGFSPLSPASLHEGI